MGVHTVISQMAADALNIPIEKIELVSSDTALAGDSGSVSASRMFDGFRDFVIGLQTLRFDIKTLPHQEGHIAYLQMSLNLIAVHQLARDQGHVWSIKQSQLYALLDRLEEDELIRSVIIPGDSRPNRKEYHLTPAGEQRFAEWLEKPVSHSRDIRIEFLAKLYFALPAGSTVALDLLAAQEEVCLGWLHQSQRSAESAPAASTYGKMVFDYRIGQIQATLSWIQATRAEIQSGKK